MILLNNRIIQHERWEVITSLRRRCRHGSGQAGEGGELLSVSYGTQGDYS